MKKGSRGIAMLASLALLIGALVGTAGTAKAQAELTVLNGFPLFEAAQGAPADGMRFYAPELNVHQGDVINFQWAGFHTATLLPAGEDAEAWVAENASEFGDPHFAILEDPDDTGLDPGSSAAKPAVKFNAHNILLPSDFTCGAAGNPCSYDGSAIVNSGLPLAEDADVFSVSVDATPNTSFWVICLLHPNMRLKVNVVPGGEEATTQAEVDAYADDTIASDAAEAAALHTKLQKPKKKNGVWQAFGGVDGDGFALLGMYPKRLKIKKGDRVRWRFDRLPFELHTVSFPRKKALEIIQGDFVPACDPDGDEGPGPDTPPELEGPPFCNDPSQLEFELEPRSMHQYGNGKVTGANDFETSGVRGEFGFSEDPYTLKFKKTSGKKGFKYICMIHGGFMGGRVVVKPRK
jgi:plastocyanin